MSLGTCPTIGLKEARLRRDEARRLLANGIDPGARRQAAKAIIRSKRVDSFEAVSREWFARHVSPLAPSYAKKVPSLFEKLNASSPAGKGTMSAPRTITPGSCPSGAA